MNPKHLLKLVGGTITAIAEDDHDETLEIFGESIHGLVITMPNGKKVNAFIMADPEGNGPGHLHIEEA